MKKNKYYLKMQNINPRSAELILATKVFIFCIPLVNFGVVFFGDEKSNKKWNKANRMCHLLNLLTNVSKED